MLSQAVFYDLLDSLDGALESSPVYCPQYVRNRVYCRKYFPPSPLGPVSTVVKCMPKKARLVLAV